MWGVPVDHEIFGEINSAQWLWYSYNFTKDQEEKYYFTRDFTEYLASFIEPKAVHQIREARKKAVTIDDNNFAQIVKGVFGRSLPNAAPTDENKVSNQVDMNELIKNMNALKPEKTDSIFNYRHWAQIELE